MSQPETETPTEPTEPTEPVEPETEPVEPEAEPTEPTEPTPDEGQSIEAQAKEQDETWNTLNRKGANYAKAVVAILEETPVSVAVCEMCADSIPGFRMVPPQDELRAALAQVVQGVAALEDLEEDPDAEQCPTCKGKGVLRVSTDVPQNKVRGCKRCNGAGYLERHAESGSLIAAVPDTPNGQTEPIHGVPLDDPVIADLVARGFTVVPPMQPMQTAG
jgi:ribosomal protein L37AE/L43A